MFDVYLPQDLGSLNERQRKRLGRAVDEITLEVRRIRNRKRKIKRWVESSGEHWTDERTAKVRESWADLERAMDAAYERAKRTRAAFGWRMVIQYPDGVRPVRIHPPALLEDPGSTEEE